jgi:cation transport protein ChaC
MPNTMWVFGYGSLIWNPEFQVAEHHIARLADWRRSFLHALDPSSRIR